MQYIEISNVPQNNLQSCALNKVVIRYCGQTEGRDKCAQRRSGSCLLLPELYIAELTYRGKTIISKPFHRR